MASTIISLLLSVIFLLCCGSAFTQLVVHSPPEIAGTYTVATLTFKGTPPNLIGTTINGTLVTVSNPNSMSNIMLAPYQGIPATDYVIRNYQVFLSSVIVLITNRLGTRYLMLNLCLLLTLGIFQNTPVLMNLSSKITNQPTI
jgi:hypothetical protein